MASVALEVGIARHRTGADMDRQAEAYEVQQQQQQQAQRQGEAQRTQREALEQQKLQPQS